MMSHNSVTVQGVACKPYMQNDGVTVIDLRPAGYLKETIPKDLFRFKTVMKLFLCHENALSFLDATSDSLPPSITIEMFGQCDKNHPYAEEIDGKYLWKTCHIEIDEHGSTFLDLRCRALSGQPLKFQTPKRLRQLILRDYEDGVLAGDSNGTYEFFEELIISGGRPGDKTLIISIGVHPSGYKDYETLTSIFFKGITVSVSRSWKRVGNLQQLAKFSRPFLGEMFSLRKFFVSAGGNKILPTGLDRLPYLEEISMTDNPIAHELALWKNLINVKRVNLFNCGLELLSNCMKAFPDVQELNICGNNSLGSHPVILPQSAHLKKLNMCRCGLQEPPSGLEECLELEELDLSCNGRLGNHPVTLPKSKHLKKLNMCGCGLQEPPAGLEECSQLEELDLSSNWRLGKHQVALPKSEHLKKLNLHWCGLQESPAGLEEFSELELLDLSSNGWLGNHQVTLPKSKHLKQLNLHWCGLQKPPAGLEECSELEELDLSANGSLGNHPVTLPKSEHLKKLNLSYCGLQELPAGLEECLELEELDLSWSRKLGNHPVTFPKSEHLKKLNLSRCGLQELPAGLEECSELEELNLSSNGRLGNHPVTLPKSEHLKKLNLSGCGLQQSPAGLEECWELEELDLSENERLGNQPVTLPKSKHLKKLNLSGCGLQQSPAGLEECLELEELDLRRNWWLCNHPVTLPKSKHLKKLDLSGCGLQQSPAGLGKCLELEELDLRENKKLGPYAKIYRYPSIDELKQIRDAFSKELLLVEPSNVAVESVSKVSRHRYYSKGIGDEEHRQLKTRKVEYSFVKPSGVTKPYSDKLIEDEESSRPKIKGIGQKFQLT